MATHPLPGIAQRMKICWDAVRFFPAARSVVPVIPAAGCPNHAYAVPRFAREDAPHLSKLAEAHLGSLDSRPMQERARPQSAARPAGSAFRLMV